MIPVPSTCPGTAISSSVSAPGFSPSFPVSDPDIMDRKHHRHPINQYRMFSFFFSINARSAVRFRALFIGSGETRDGGNGQFFDCPFIVRCSQCSQLRSKWTSSVPLLKLPKLPVIR